MPNFRRDSVMGSLGQLTHETNIVQNSAKVVPQPVDGTVYQDETQKLKNKVLKQGTQKNGRA